MSEFVTGVCFGTFIAKHLKGGDINSKHRAIELNTVTSRPLYSLVMN